jgi:hypothetical protein
LNPGGGIGDIIVPGKNESKRIGFSSKHGERSAAATRAGKTERELKRIETIAFNSVFIGVIKLLRCWY